MYIDVLVVGLMECGEGMISLRDLGDMIRKCFISFFSRSMGQDIGGSVTLLEQ